jgi:GR25 family glycosyltransferase involved in LPS biosynthesis
MINNFKNKYCVNLDRREDRWIESQKIFTIHNIENVIRFRAVDGNPDNKPHNIRLSPSMIGCTLSHLNIIKHARDNRFENILIFEDDVAFVDNFSELFDQYIEQVPQDWDMIYLGGSHWGDGWEYRIKGGFDMVSKNVARLHETLTTHAYIMRNTVFDFFIEILEKLDDIVDVCYAQNHKNIKAYGFRPNIAYQRSGFSDIMNQNVDYHSLKEI